MATVTLKPTKVPELMLEGYSITPDTFSGKTPVRSQRSLPTKGRSTSRSGTTLRSPVLREPQRQTRIS